MGLDTEILELTSCPYCLSEKIKEDSRDMDSKYIEYYCFSCCNDFDNEEDYTDCYIELSYCPFCDSDEIEEDSRDEDSKSIYYYCPDCANEFNNKDDYTNCKKIKSGYSSHGCEREGCPYRNTSTCQSCDGD